MDPRNQLQALWTQIEELPHEDQHELLLRFFADEAKCFRTADLQVLRQRFERDGNPVSIELAEVIEGQLALRLMHAAPEV